MQSTELRSPHLPPAPVWNIQSISPAQYLNPNHSIQASWKKHRKIVLLTTSAGKHIHRETIKLCHSHCSTQFQHTVTTSDFHVPFKNNKIQLSSFDWRGMIVAGFKTKRRGVLKGDVRIYRERMYKYMLVGKWYCFSSWSCCRPNLSHTVHPFVTTEL